MLGFSGGSASRLPSLNKNELTSERGCPFPLCRTDHRETSHGLTSRLEVHQQFFPIYFRIARVEQAPALTDSRATSNARLTESSLKAVKELLPCFPAQFNRIPRTRAFLEIAGATVRVAGHVPCQSGDLPSLQ